MAGDAVVGALRVVLGLDTGSFEDGAKRASSQISEFGKRVFEIFTGVGLANIVEKTFEKIIDTFKEAGVKAFEFADKMGNMAQKVGISVEELTGLKLAADISSVSMESLSAGLGKLSKSMVDATNNVGDSKLQFQALGISVRDATGALKSPLAVLTDIAAKFEDSRDGAAKTAAALALLGKGGKDLIPLLNEGAASLKEFAQIAKNMGLEISTNTAAQASVLNKNIIILQSSLQGVANQVFANVAPALVRMTTELVNTVKGGEAIRETANTITDSIKTVVTNVIIIIEANQKLGAAFHELEQGVSASVLGIVDTLNRSIEPIVAWTKLLADALVFRDFKKIPDDVTNVIKSFQDLKDALGSPQFDRANSHFEAMRANIDELGKISAPAAAIVESLFKKLEEHAKHAADAVDAPDKKMEQLRLHILSLDIQATDAKQGFSNYAVGLAEAALSLKLVDEQTGELTDKNGELLPGIGRLNVAMLNLQGAKLTNEFLSPWDVYAQKIQQINNLQAANKIGTEAAQSASLKAAATMASSWGEAASAIVSPVASAFKSLADINKKYAGIAKAAAIADATVNTFVAANKAFAAFAFAPPLAFAAAAAATAAGLANVAKIAATPFAQGGKFKVGGVGGVDSQLVQFKATPGEMVDIRKPGATTTTSEITVNMRGRDLVSKDMIRDLFNAINEGTRDGYRLKLAEA